MASMSDLKRVDIRDEIMTLATQLSLGDFGAENALIKAIKCRQNGDSLWKDDRLLYIYYTGRELSSMKHIKMGDYFKK